MAGQVKNGHNGQNGGGHSKRRLSRDGLNPRQRRFLAEYLVDYNGTQAAIRAGYAPLRADQQASRLLAQPAVKAAIEARLKRYEVTADVIIAELSRIAKANMLDYMAVQPSGDAVVDLSHLTRDEAAAISEMTSEDFVDGRGDDARDVRRTRIKLYDKIRALELLGKRFRMWTEQVELSGDAELLAALAAGRARAAAGAGAES